MPERVAIIAAMEREIAPLVRKWKRTSLVVDGQGTRLRYESAAATAVVAGIGAEPARRVAEALAREERPSLLISAGFAGGLDPDWTAGRVLCPAGVIDGESGERFHAQGAGTLVTVGRILNSAGKQELRGRYKADAVDMEAAAVAGVAARAGVPFMAVKAISDEAGFPMPDFAAWVDANGEVQVAKAVIGAAMRPWLWPVLWRLRQQAARASEELSRELAKVIERQGTATEAPAHAGAGRVREY